MIYWMTKVKLKPYLFTWNKILFILLSCQKKYDLFGREEYMHPKELNRL